jgi:hypothetical protein
VRQIQGRFQKREVKAPQPSPCLSYSGISRMRAALRASQ